MCDYFPMQNLLTHFFIIEAGRVCRAVRAEPVTVVEVNRTV